MIFAGSFLVGCLFTGMFLYLLDLLFDTRSHFISHLIYFVIVLLYIGLSLRHLALHQKFVADLLDFLRDRWLVGFFFLSLIFATWLDYHTFSTRNGNIKVVGAWSDIMFHHAFVRTISQGNNIPPQYPYYTNSPVHYHFLFDYFAAKIAQLGLNSVHALNLFSLFSLAFLLVLIFEFGRSYFKSTAVGIIGAIFLMFHSSFTAFTLLAQNLHPKFLSSIMQRTGWLNGAPFEGWGLFNLNVFIAQRQLAFSLGYLILVTYLILSYRKECQTSDHSLNWNLIKKNIFLGLMIGALPFWHAIIAAICLGFIALFGLTGITNRNFFYGMICAGVIGGILVFPQLALFKTNDPMLAHYPAFHLGYALEQFTVPGFFKYYFQVFGIKLILLIAAFFVVVWQKKFDFLIFLFPFVLTNVFQLGPILYDNNKLIIISLIFINCYVAYVLVRLYQKIPRLNWFLPICLFLALIFGGIIDFFAVRNMMMCEISDQNPLKEWVMKNTKTKAVFLTGPTIPFDDNNMTTIILAGRRLYAVHNNTQHIGETDRRFETLKKLYSFNGDPAELKSLLKQEGIDYILIDEASRNCEEYQLNEKIFQANFKREYQKNAVTVYSYREG